MNQCLIFKRVAEVCPDGTVIKEKELTVQGRLTDKLSDVKKIFDEEWKRE